MDLSKYDELGEMKAGALKEKYAALRQQLESLMTAPDRDMAAIDALIVELDEVQAGFKNAHKRPDDPQRF